MSLQNKKSLINNFMAQENDGLNSYQSYESTTRPDYTFSLK